MKRIINLCIGPIIMILICVFLPAPVFNSFESKAAIGLVLWMAYWWVSAPVDYAVTAFLPIAINAILPIADMNKVISNYSSETILLLLGASILTVSWERTGLDKRIASACLKLVGPSFRMQVIYWFLISCLLSSILPNAVVCATITPIAVAMLNYVGEGDIGSSKIASKILLTVVYATGVGGLISPLGGAMNLVAVEYIQELTGSEFMYMDWVIRLLPISIVLIVSNIIYMLRDVDKNIVLGEAKQYFEAQSRSLEKMKRDERIVFVLFIVATVMSFVRPLYQSILPGLKPAYIFIICAILSFLVKNDEGERLMIWKSVQKGIVWELIYIFAGGLAAGSMIKESGAADCIGRIVSSFGTMGDATMIFIIISVTIILSDITSNTATAAVAIPIVISIAEGSGRNPVPYIFVSVIGVNLSYMLPTSIRAIPVGYGLKPKYMLKEGWKVTVIEILLMSIMSMAFLKFWK